MSEEFEIFKDFLYEVWAMQYWRVAAFMLLLWFVYLIIKNAALVDFGWIMNYVVLGSGLFALYAKTKEYKFFLFYGLLLCWAARLGGYILITRVCKALKDQRYEKMGKTKSNKELFFLFNYQLQGFLATICGCTLYFTFRKPEVENLYTIIIGSILIVIGVIGEAISDHQLYSYKNRKDKQSGEILQTGLWKKSRHPNLFFELVVWVGFAVAGINDNGIEALGFIGPLVLWSIMNFLTMPYHREAYVGDKT